MKLFRRASGGEQGDDFSAEHALRARLMARDRDSFAALVGPTIPWSGAVPQATMEALMERFRNW